MDDRVGLVVLAAGGSKRLGAPKQLLVYRGQSLLRRAARTAIDSGLGPVVVVLGCASDRLQSELHDLPVQLVQNVDWANGMGTSIRAGVRAVRATAEVRAVVLMLCDQPLVCPELLRSLAAAHQPNAVPVVACAYAGVLGVPALFDRTLFPRLEQLTDDQGARSVIRSADEAVATVPFPAGALDVDTTEDHAYLEKLDPLTRT